MATTKFDNVHGTTVADPAKPAEQPAAKPVDQTDAPYTSDDKNAQPPEHAAAGPFQVPPDDQPVAKPADVQIPAPKPKKTRQASTTKSLDDAAHDRYAAEAKQKAKADKPYPDVEQKAPVPKNGLFTIIIDGAGTMPLIDNGGRRVMRGEPAEVSQEELHWLASNGCGFRHV